MTYTVKECYYTLQGEGAQAGRAAVFLRFAGCNLWSGLERDRESAVCRFCDTDFVGTDGPGGGKFETADGLAAHVRGVWTGAAGDTAGGSANGAANAAAAPFVVCTGGEPLLQVDAALIDALHASGFEIAVETNGTRPAPTGLDWICVSPKAGADIVQTSGHELKLVYPQDGAAPALFEGLDFSRFYLQPMDGPALAENTARAIAYCRAHPQWRLSVQTHKLIGIP